MSVLNLLSSVREAFVDWRSRERAYAQLMLSLIHISEPTRPY